MKISEILATIKLGEGLQTEFKESLSKNNERGVCKEIAAFATSQGGVILLGVTDSGALVGVDDPALICEKIERWVSGRIKPAPLVEISKRTVRGKDVVVVHVTNGVAPFYQFDGIPYIRIGSSSLPMDPAQVVDVVRGRKIEDIIQSIEATLAATQASLSSTHSVAMVAMTAISPGIAGQGELATMSYQQIRERILHDLAISPLMLSLNASVSTAQAMASLASISTAPAIVGQGDLATMNYYQLRAMLMPDVDVMIGSLNSSIMAIQSNILMIQAELSMIRAKFIAISSASA